MEKAQALVEPVKIEMYALAPVEFEMSGLLIATDKPGPARLHRTDHGNQTLLDSLAFHFLARQILLVITVALQIDHSPVQALGQMLRRSPDPVGQLGQILLKVLEQDFL